MGTPNFASPSNASKYFVVLTNQEVKQRKCKECGEKHFEWEYDLEDLKECQMDGCKGILGKLKTKTKAPEDWAGDDLIDNIGEEILLLGGYKENKRIGYGNSYGVQSIGYLQESKSFGDISLDVNITAVIQSAYYEGATLDWLVEINGQDSYESAEDAIDGEFDTWRSDMNKGMLKIQGRNAENWIEKTITELSEKIEAIFETWSEHKLGCTGVFSNGEAIYHTIE